MKIYHPEEENPESPLMHPDNVKATAWRGIAAITLMLMILAATVLERCGNGN